MKQEEKKLLLTDLCARLPYGVIGEYSWKRSKSYNKELTGNLYDELKSSWNSTGDSEFLPYLRPMSSMTEEESKEFAMLQTDFYSDGWLYPIAAVNMVNWLNAHHFDYRGLIERGLAIEITKENNPYENNH